MVVLDHDIDSHNITVDLEENNTLVYESLNTSEIGDPTHYPLHQLSIYELCFWFTMYSTIAFLSVAGNTLVIYIILSRERMRTVTNYFILNLSLGDALTGLLAIPFKFQLISPPGNMNVSICYPTHVEDTWWKVYNIYLTIVQYFVPLIIINGAYAIIAYKVYSAEAMGPQTVPSPSFEKSKRKVLKMLIIVMAVFTFCWLPYEGYLLLNEVWPSVNDFYYINVVFFGAHWLAMSNSCLNPIIYGIYNEKFQSEYRRVFRSMKLQRKKPDRRKSLEDMKASSEPLLTTMARQNGVISGCHYYIAAELGKSDSYV